MSKVSLNTLRQSGDIKRDNGFLARLSDIFIQPDFNRRDQSVLIDGVSFDQYIRNLADYIGGGGYVPPLELELRDDSKFWLRDGECRYRAYKLLESEGKGIEWIKFEPFKGNFLDAKWRVFETAIKRPLSSIEQAALFLDFQKMGVSNDEIAKRSGMTRQRVGQLLLLNEAPESLRDALKKGEISATEVTGLIQTHGNSAESVFKQASDAAKQDGKTKVTRKHITAAVASVEGSGKEEAEPKEPEQPKIRKWSSAEQREIIEALSTVTALVRSHYGLVIPDMAAAVRKAEDLSVRLNSRIVDEEQGAE